MAFGTRGVFDLIRELAFGGISGTYAAIGTPFGNHIRLLGITNTTDQEIYITFDGIGDNLRMARNSFKDYDISTNKIQDDGLFLASGTQIYIKEVSASVTEGDVWVEVLGAEGGK